MKTSMKHGWKYPVALPHSQPTNRLNSDQLCKAISVRAVHFSCRSTQKQDLGALLTTHNSVLVCERFAPMRIIASLLRKGNQLSARRVASSVTGRFETHKLREA